MTEEQKTKQVIEITTYPKDGRMEMTKMANSMLAINADYRQWLSQQKLSPDDPDLKLYIERVRQGSVKLWLGQFKDVGIPLIKYGLDFFQKVESPKKNADKWSIAQLRNMRRFFSNNIGSKMEAKFLEFKGGNKFNVKGDVYIISPQKFEEGRDVVRDLLAKRKQKREKTPIVFVEYNIESGAARIIARDVEPHNSYKADLWMPAHALLCADRKTIFTKEHIANITVRRMVDSGDIHSYIVREIVAPEPSAIPSDADRKE